MAWCDDCGATNGWKDKKLKMTVCGKCREVRRHHALIEKLLLAVISNQVGMRMEFEKFKEKK